MLGLAAALALGGSTATGAPTPGQLCQSGKNKVAGKYGLCRQKAEAKFALTNDGASYDAALQKCVAKYELLWQPLEDKAAGACPSTGDQTSIKGAIDVHTTAIAAALAGGSLPDCTTDLATCQGNLATCGSDLAACQAAPQGQRLRTGQTQCWNTAGGVIGCAATGQDGELQKGLARAYVDNGNGTVTDTRTGLMWEKLSDDGSVHDWDNSYTWANAFAVKVAALNAGSGFAGHTDWRLPNINELQSLLNYGAVSPAVSSAFNTGCAPTCTVLTCSCTTSWYYSSSSSYQSDPSRAWIVDFTDGYTEAWDDLALKSIQQSVRAVRGGS